jgi:ParB family chromosome partitioning protein
MGGDNYQIISGERRTRAAMMSGLTQIPAYIRTANDQGMLEMALIENIQRSELNAIEIALSYQRLIEECSLKQEELGERVGKERSTVTNYLRLLKLPDEIQIGIKEGKISMGHARAMINLPTEEHQMALYRDIIENKMSVRDVESAVKEKKQNPEKDFGLITGTDWDPEIDRITEELHRRLKSAVHLKNGSKGKGKIVISYKNREDLERILELIHEI